MNIYWLKLHLNDCLLTLTSTDLSASEYMMLSYVAVIADVVMVSANVQDD